MRVITLQNLTNGTGTFAKLLGRLQAHLVHRVQDAPMYRLQAIAHIGQRATHDHTHRVIEIGCGHFINDTYRFYIAEFHKTAHPHQKN